jgi:MinD superfamily P-loop ATPase
MTELVIVSGKGGTGKTSLVGSLAALASDKVLVDCDVDAADLHLILKNKVRDTHQFTGGRRASIIAEKCTGCGLCPEYCRFDAIKHEWDACPGGGEWYAVDRHACDGCGVCVRHCPEEAIDFRAVIGGEWYLSETSYGPLLHARLGMAQANSGKLVSILRQQARLLAEAHGHNLIIVDGPPGIGCPVIASITGSRYVLIVTEPSMSAVHDMERLLELTAHFNIPTGICINKCDINPDMSDLMEAKAQRLGLPVLGRVQHDMAVTRAQLNREPVVSNGDSPAAGDIRTLWRHVQHAIM